MKIGKQMKKTMTAYSRRAKAKISRLKSKGIDVTGYLDFDLKPTFKNRKEYNAWKKKIDAFTNRNNSDFKVYKNKYDTPYLGIEKKLIEKNTKEAIKKAEDEQKRLKALQSDSGRTVGEDRSVLKDKEYGFIKKPTMLTMDELPSRNVIQKRIEKMTERASDEYFIKRNTQMRDNWLNLMRISFGDEAEGLIAKIMLLPLDDYVELFWKFRDFKFEWYDSKRGYMGGKETPEQLVDLEDTVDRVLSGTLDLKLKGFR